MGMKVCKLVRLTKKNEGGGFVYSEKSKEGQILLRKRVVVDESTVEESEGNFATSGLLYVVDAKATAERDELVNAEVEASKAPTEEVSTDKL